MARELQPFERGRVIYYSGTIAAGQTMFAAMGLTATPTITQTPTFTSTATITVYPPPSAGLTLYIHSWKQMQSVADLSTQVLFPSGYRLMFESNFAIHLASGFTPVSAEVAKLARESKAAIKKLNLPDMVMRLDKGTRIGVSIDHGIYIDGQYIE